MSVLSALTASRPAKLLEGNFKKILRIARTPGMNAPRFASFVLSRVSFRARRSTNFSLPSVLYIECTSACNLHCAICPTGIGTLNRPKARMTMEDFRSLIDQGESALTRVVLAGYGEPFLNPLTYDFITYARSKKIFTELYSNLLLLEDDDLRRVIRTGLDLLVVAVDFAEEGKNWRFVHKTPRDIDKVKDRLRRLSELKRELGSSLPVIRVSYPVTKENEPMLEEARAFARSIDAEFLPKTVNAVVAGESFVQMEKKWVADKYNRYKAPKVGGGHCRWPYSGALVYANGEVSPCCHLARGEHHLGNVFKDGLKNVWNGEEYKKFRLRLMTEPETVPHCAQCTERFGGI